MNVIRKTNKGMKVIRKTNKGMVIKKFKPQNVFHMTLTTVMYLSFPHIVTQINSHIIFITRNLNNFCPQLILSKG